MEKLSLEFLPKMATEKESEKTTAETLTFGFTEPNTPKTLGLVPIMLDETGYVSNEESFPVYESEQDVFVDVDEYMENPPLAKGSRESAMELGVSKSATKKDGGAEKEADYMVNHSYSVGDFVWGQMKWLPWWPGRIYDPSRASEFALKYREAGRLLVVYFGDSSFSFSWCLPSQLKPFAENFEEKSTQSSVKSFVNAVEKALAEIGTLLELEMTCKCELQEHISELSRPLAVNAAGMKAQVLVPNCDTRKLSLPRYEPHLVLFMLRNLAQATSLPSNRMEIVVLTSWLSAFYRAKGGYRLCCYCEPSPIEGLEDMATNHASDMIDLNAAMQAPIVIADDKVYRRRNQKRLSKLVVVSIGSDDQNASGSVAGMMESEKEEGGFHNLSIAKSLKKRKPMAIECGENGALDNLEVAREENESPLSRKKKKSKYLSFPYTSLSGLTGSCSLAKEGFELGSKIGRVSETIAMPELRRKQTNLYEAADEDMDAGSKLFPISFMVTFSPGHSLPSKEEVVKIFSRYGALNVKETNTYYNSNFVQVVYENGSDAEAAFREAIKQSPFAAASRVNFMLRHCSDAPMARAGSSPRHPNPKPVLHSDSEYEEILLFGSIKRNITILKSMLKKRCGIISQEEKLYLEDQFKVLLEKVRTMDAAAP